MLCREGAASLQATVTSFCRIHRNTHLEGVFLRNLDIGGKAYTLSKISRYTQSQCEFR